MSELDVFISYKREQRDLAHAVAGALDQAGFEVFTDHDIPVGRDFSDVIDDSLRAAALVVVIWTKEAADSGWVKNEAREALRMDKYFGVRFDDVLPEDLPIEARYTHWLDVSELPLPDGLQRIVEEASEVLGIRSDDTVAPSAPEAATPLGDANPVTAESHVIARAGSEHSESRPGRRVLPWAVMGGAVLGAGMAGAVFFTPIASFLSPLPKPDCTQNDQPGFKMADRCIFEGTEVLDLSGLPVSDLFPLLGMPKLTSLRLRSTNVTDVSILTGVTGLKYLSLSDTDVVDISALASLQDLRDLFLTDTRIGDIRPLASLPGLEALWMSGSSVTDISPLAGLKNLRAVALGNTNVQDITALAGLTKLEVLYLQDTYVRDLSALAGLHSLQALFLGGSDVRDVSPLLGLKKLHYIELPDGSVAGGPDTPENQGDVRAALIAWSP